MSIIFRLITFVLLWQLAPLLSAQTLLQIDLDPPQVDHIPFSSGIAGEAQSFSVKAVDTQGIASATLFYRIQGDTDYRQVTLTQASGTENYTVLVQTTTLQQAIEYYFLVIDQGGNKVLNGFPYEPFTRTLVAPVAEPVTTAIKPAEVPIIEPAESNRFGSRNTILFSAIGVLLVGALLSSSGSGESSENGGEQVPVVVNVPLP